MAELPPANAYGNRSSARQWANRTVEVVDSAPLVGTSRHEQARAASATPSVAVSLIIPVRNEARNIAWVLEQVADDVSEIILVDAPGGSARDATGDDDVQRRHWTVVCADRRGPR